MELSQRYNAKLEISNATFHIFQFSFSISLPTLSLQSEMDTSGAYVTLVSADNHKFVVLKEVALISSVLRSTQGFEEGKTGKISLDMDGDILECVVEYLYYHYKYKEQAESGAIPEFHIPTHLALELLVKADFLDI